MHDECGKNILRDEYTVETLKIVIKIFEIEVYLKLWPAHWYPKHKFLDDDDSKMDQ